MDTDTVVPPPKGKAPPAKVQQHVLVNRESSIQIATGREKDGSIKPDGLLFLAPGWNLVDAELWAKARQNPSVQQLLKLKIPPATAPEESPEKVGHMVLVEGKQCDADNPLVALSEGEALRYVAETFQVPLLQRLVGQEQRANVLRAIRGQIERIEGAKQQAAAAKATKA